MRYTRVSLKSLTFFFIALMGFILLFPNVQADAGEYSSPRRLRLRVEESILTVGDKTKLFVEFLDETYQQVPNDSIRVIEFEEISAGSGQTGSGEIAPRRVIIQPGMWSSLDITFEAKVPGKLMVRATSGELASTQILLIILQREDLSLVPSLNSISPDPSNMRLEILPKEVSPVSANGISPVTLWVTWKHASSLDKPLMIRVTTRPASKILYKGQEWRGTLDIQIDGRRIGSEQINIISSRARKVRVLAQVLRKGFKDQVTVRFQHPRPTRIFFEKTRQTIPVHQREVALSLKLVDQNQVTLKSSDRRQIHLSSPTDPDIALFNPENLILSSTRPFGQSMLLLKDFPTEGQIRLLAEDSENHLEPGHMILTLESPIQKVLVTGPSKIYRYSEDSKECFLTLYLADEAGNYLKADWDRKIIIKANRGEVSPKEITIAKNQESVDVTYLLPGSIGEVIITAESAGLEMGIWKMNIVVATYALLLSAGWGGLLGGILRHIYKMGIKQILPGWGAGNLDLGMVGNALSGFVIGLVLFYLAKSGVENAFDPPTLATKFDLRFALLFGVLGGFGGMVVLDQVRDRLFPKRRETVSS